MFKDAELKSQDHYLSIVWVYDLHHTMNSCVPVSWVGPKLTRVPAPYPDPENPGHYMSVFDTPARLQMEN